MNVSQLPLALRDLAQTTLRWNPDTFFVLHSKTFELLKTGGTRTYYVILYRPDCYHYLAAHLLHYAAQNAAHDMNIIAHYAYYNAETVTWHKPDAQTGALRGRFAV